MVEDGGFETAGGQAEDADVDWSSYGNFEGIFGPVSHVTTGSSRPGLQSPSAKFNDLTTTLRRQPRIWREKANTVSCQFWGNASIRAYYVEHHIVGTYGV